MYIGILFLATLQMKWITSHLLFAFCFCPSLAFTLPHEFSYLLTLHITVPACDLILKSEIQTDRNSAVILLNSSLCVCLSFRAEVGTIFALSWLITWFGHVLSETKHTLRLYDFFLSSHPLMPIYLAAMVRTCRGSTWNERSLYTFSACVFVSVQEECSICSVSSDKGECTLLILSCGTTCSTSACWPLPWDTHSFTFAVRAVTARAQVFKPLTRPSTPQIVLHREKEVKQTECDMAMVHHLLSRIPQDLPYELLICQARDLFDQYPPSLLAKQAALQSHKR